MIMNHRKASYITLSSFSVWGTSIVFEILVSLSIVFVSVIFLIVEGNRVHALKSSSCRPKKVRADLSRFPVFQSTALKYPQRVIGEMVTFYGERL